jgi:hypothetical protein
MARRVHRLRRGLGRPCAGIGADRMACSRKRGWRRGPVAITMVTATLLLIASVATPAPSGATSYRAVEWGLFRGPKPAQVGELLGVTAVASDASLSRSPGISILGMSLLEAGTVMDWTENLSPMPASELAGVTAITAGSYNLALLSDGEVMEVSSNSPPVPVSGITDATAIGSSATNGAAVLSDGTVRTWGGNTHGELGDGLSNEGSEVPVEVCAVGTEGPCPHGPYLTGVKAVAVGEYFIVALMNDGTLAAWGDDVDGQLGNGCCGSPFIPNPNPVAVGALTGVTAISAGGNHGDALMSDRTVEEWGGTVDGSGVGASPSPVGGVSNVTAISSGYGFSMALLGGGTVMTWGENNVGQLGDGNRKATPSPVLVSNVAGAEAIDAGGNTALATVPASSPTVMTITPVSGSVVGGTSVTIKGKEFNQVASVKFGSTEATSVTRNSATSLTAVTPPEIAGLVDVTVTTPIGTSAISSKDHFKFTPTITSLSPNGGSTAGGTSVTVTGAGFVVGTSGTKFVFGKASKSVNCTSTTECTVVTPAHEAGTVAVKAVVNKVVSPAVPEDQFTYN